MLAHVLKCRSLKPLCDDSLTKPTHGDCRVKLSDKNKFLWIRDKILVEGSCKLYVGNDQRGKELGYLCEGSPLRIAPSWQDTTLV